MSRDDAALGDGGPEAGVRAVAALFVERGGDHYEEAISQTAHALQCAALAERDGADDALVSAALLHDVGHLLGEESDIDGLADDHHEQRGAALLGRWWPPEVCGPIALHVAAKRYLVATDPSYASGLSGASVASLAVQGGPMSSDEVSSFARHRHADAACRLRRWDDAAKVPGATTPSLDYFAPALLRAARLRRDRP